MAKNKGDRVQEQQPRITRDQFEKRFANYGPYRRMRRKPVITEDQMDKFFLIVQEYLRDSRNLPPAGENKQSLLKEAKNREAVMRDMRKTFDSFDNFRTMGSARRSLEEEYEFEDRRIQALRDRLSRKTARCAQLELSLDLLGFTRDSFPDIKKAAQRKIIGAALAGAGCLTADELIVKGGCQPGWLRERLLRAEEYRKKAYPEGRVYPWGNILDEKKQGEPKGDKN